MQIQKTRGTIYILCSCVIYSIMACLIKSLSNVSVFQITFARFVIGLFILLAMAQAGIHRLQFKNRQLLFLRGLFGCIGVFTTYLAIIKIGVSKGMVIIYSYPVFASLFGAYFLKERMRWNHFAALGIAIVGLYLLLIRAQGHEGFFRIGVYEVIAVIGAVFCGITVVIIRKLHQTETSFEIFFAQCAVGSAVFLAPAMSGGLSFGRLETGLLLTIGITAAVGQLIMTQGFRYLPVKIGSLLSMSELVLNYTAGILIFGESLTDRAVIGSVLIFSSCMAVLLSREKT